MLLACIHFPYLTANAQCSLNATFDLRGQPSGSLSSASILRNQKCGSPISSSRPVTVTVIPPPTQVGELIPGKSSLALSLCTGDTLQLRGCDSILVLEVSQAPIADTILQVSICSGQTYQLNENAYVKRFLPPLAAEY